MELIYSSEDAISQSSGIVGGKAWGLAQLTLHGYLVPNWLVIPSQAWHLQTEQNGLGKWLEEKLNQADLKKPDSLSLLSDLLIEKITAQELHPDLRGALNSQFLRQALSEDTFYAIRSSAIGEDSLTASFAGQLDSYLYRRGIDSMMDAIKKCWASAFSYRALLYRMKKQISVQEIEVAVIIQEMIDSDISGVLYTAHPQTGNRKTAVVSSTYGLCAGVVSGECDTDEYVVHLLEERVHSTLADKKTMLAYDSNQGTGIHVQEVSKNKQHSTSLNEPQVLDIVRTGLDIANHLGGPQDIEWTIKADQVFILQSRPITVLPLDKGLGEQEIIWDNSNIQESYCGVTTPLTFSFASRAYAIVYEQMMRIAGLSEKLIAEYEPILTNLLGFIKGRIYYNINNWYRGLLLLPAFDLNKAAMERMMGLTDPVDFIQDKKSSIWQKLRSAPFLLMNGLILYRKMAQLDKLVPHFQVHFLAIQNKIGMKKLSMLNFPELVNLANLLDRELLNKWHAPILNDFFVMLSNGKVLRRMQKMNITAVEDTLNMLIAGEKDMESIEPTKILLHLANVIKNAPELSDLFNNYSDTQLLPMLRKVNTQFYRDCQDFIARYGDRVPGELKLESKSLREDPSYMFMILRNYIVRSDFTGGKITEVESKVRDQAEDMIRQELRKSGYWGRKGFWRDLEKLRRGVRYRENLRMARTRLFGFYRDIYLEIGDRFAASGILDTKGDIFFLTVDEINQLAEGRAVQTDLRAIVSSRRNEYEQYENIELPHQFKTSELIYYQQDYSPPQKGMPTPPGPLAGTGCFPGIVEEVVEVIKSPNDGLKLDGQILCAQRTDPGWTPLFPVCSGILVERGSTLSHSAVIARELGIPTIVGIPGLTKRIRTGDRVRMDGGTGEIQVLTE